MQPTLNNGSPPKKAAYAPEVRKRFFPRKKSKKGIKIPRKIVGYINQFFDTERWQETQKKLLADNPIVMIFVKAPTGQITNTYIRKLKGLPSVPISDLKNLPRLKSKEELEAEAKAKETKEEREKQLQLEIEKDLQLAKERGPISEDVELTEGVQIVLKSEEVVTISEIILDAQGNETGDIEVRFPSGRKGTFNIDYVKGVSRPS